MKAENSTKKRWSHGSLQTVKEQISPSLCIPFHFVWSPLWDRQRTSWPGLCASLSLSKDWTFVAAWQQKGGVLTSLVKKSPSLGFTWHLDGEVHHTSYKHFSPPCLQFSSVFHFLIWVTITALTVEQLTLGNSLQIVPASYAVEVQNRHKQPVSQIKCRNSFQSKHDCLNRIRIYLEGAKILKTQCRGPRYTYT